MLPLKANPEIKHKDATGKLVCSALTTHYHHCVVCFVLTTVTLTLPLGWNCSLLRSCRNSNAVGEKLSEMLKFPARESYCFTLIVFVLTRQETIKNNNTEQYLLFSNWGRFSWYVGKSKSNDESVEHSRVLFIPFNSFNISLILFFVSNFKLLLMLLK